jgi:APA family basic amino acid/polyamine antiporter
VVTQPDWRDGLAPFDAVIIGLGSMQGAGVFAAFSPAAAAAGAGLLIRTWHCRSGRLLQCHCLAAQLAAQYPTSGGTYIYGRRRLGPWWGFLAGWGFVYREDRQLRSDGPDFRGLCRARVWQRPVAIGGSDHFGSDQVITGSPERQC